MGTEEYGKRNNNYSLDVNEDLIDEIQKELNIKKRKKTEKHFKKMITKNMKKKIKKTDFFQKFNKKDKGIKKISNLLNLIYDENINRNLENAAGRTIYEGVFGSKNISDIQDNNSQNIEDIENNSKNNDANDSEEYNNNNLDEYNNNFEVNNNNNLDEYNNENQYQEYQNNFEENNNIDYNNLEDNNNNIYNNNADYLNNNLKNDINLVNINNYEIAREVSEYDRRSKIINVEKLPNEEPIDNYQYNLNNQEIPLINNNNNNYETNQYICNEFEINFNLKKLKK